MRVLHNICDILEDELEDIVKTNSISMQDLEIVDKSVDVIKDIKTIEAMEQSFDDWTHDSGYSNRAYYDDGYSMARGGRGNMRHKYLRED